MRLIVFLKSGEYDNWYCLKFKYSFANKYSTNNFILSFPVILAFFVSFFQNMDLLYRRTTYATMLYIDVNTYSEIAIKIFKDMLLRLVLEELEELFGDLENENLYILLL